MCKSVFTWCLEDGWHAVGAWAALNDAGKCAKGWNLESLCLPLNDIPVYDIFRRRVIRREVCSRAWPLNGILP